MTLSEEALKALKAIRKSQNVPKQCPDCGSEQIIPFVRGMPDSALMELSQAGLVQSGGCLVMGNEPNWTCKACSDQDVF